MGINIPNQRHIDIFYMAYEPICNQQLAIMWKRVIRIAPAWLLAPIDKFNRIIPGGYLHEIGNNSQSDRDIHNLMERLGPHLEFTTQEERHGEACLRAMGIPVNQLFICLNIRDSAYLSGPGWDYHNYRDSKVENYVLTAEALAERGFFVIRMGAKVHSPMNSTNPKVIDYATNGMRSDFMDIYLGAKCHFAISTQSGWDCVPYIFRKPICYVNALPIGYFMTFQKKVLYITKRHKLKTSQKELSLTEIFNFGVGYSLNSSEYESKGIELVENSPEEILDVAIEMLERLNGSWYSHPDEDSLQRRFWQIFPIDAVDAFEGKPLHGKVNSRFGSKFLLENREWLD
jgi:putative glycosyltransferase (TIGR04372 family)